MRPILLAFFLAYIWVGLVPDGSAQPDGMPPVVADPVGVPPSRQQDSTRLTWISSAVIPADGLWSVGLGWRTYSTVYLLDGFLSRVNQSDIFLLTELTPLSWFNVWAELPWRSWSEGTSYIPPSGSGLGDGRWLATVGIPIKDRLLHAALIGGGNIPSGDENLGLTEGVFSPRAGGIMTFRFWTENQVPEMRLHLNAWYRWNKAEETGYGMGTAGFQPWPPRYQSAAEAGGSSRNDAWTLAGGLEFRKGTTSLWVEYSQEIFPDNATLTHEESLRLLGAGLRWGVVEGWALHGDYLVSMSNDNENTAWYPAYPDWLMSLAVSRQFSVGGGDKDGDGIVDRKDSCPDLPEDRDGWQDSDGCPDYDNDRDGVPDLGDGAPDQPEDYDGHNDKDGCPDDFRDADGDGVEDDSDGCPDQAEDIDGFDDEDGCPDTDNDLDGVPDAEDECPDEAEDYDGDRDQDGCPD